MLYRCLLFIGLCLMAIGPVTAQVKIHDTAVRLLAKPFGIEKRIELQSIDGLHCAADGTKRVIFTLRSSGVKEVVLKAPVFSLDIVMPGGNWASLGTLCGCGITFPLTGKTTKQSRTYVADFKSELSRDDLEAYFRRAENSGARMRLIGRAKMIVNSDGKTDFSKKDLKLELGGPMKLSDDFEATDYRSARSLPEVGAR